MHSKVDCTDRHSMQQTMEGPHCRKRQLLMVVSIPKSREAKQPMTNNTEQQEKHERWTEKKQEGGSGNPQDKREKTKE